MGCFDGQNSSNSSLPTEPFEEKEPVFSPDGHWVAYVSDASGQNEVYVQPFEGGSQRVQISSEGGDEPSWARTGREIFYRKGGKMMSVSVNASPELRVGKPALLFSGSYSFNIIPNRDYDVGRDGRFIMVQPDSTVNSRQINVVLNWSNELGRQAPPNNQLTLVSVLPQSSY